MIVIKIMVFQRKRGAAACTASPKPVHVFSRQILFLSFSLWLGEMNVDKKEFLKFVGGGGGDEPQLPTT